MLGKVVVIALVALIGTSWFLGSSTGLASAQYGGVYQNGPFCPNGWVRWESVPQLNFDGWRCYENTQFQTCSDGYLVWKQIPDQYYKYYNWVCLSKPVQTHTKEEIPGGYKTKTTYREEWRTPGFKGYPSY